MKHCYAELWLLLAVMLAILGVVGFSSMAYGDEASLKSARLVERLYEAAMSKECDTVFILEPEESFVEPEIKEVAIPDTTPKVMLIIGDSMLEGINPRLAAYAKAGGHKLYSVIWYSSTTEQWGRSQRLSSYIRRVKPSLVFVSLGANELFVRDVETRRKKWVEKIVEELDTIPFIWIGPPNWREDTGINDLIADNVSETQFFRSKGMSFERKKDGAHPTRESAALWVDSIVRWMGESGYNIYLPEPQDNYSQPNKVYIHKPEDD